MNTTDEELRPLFPSASGRSWLEMNQTLFPSEQALRWFFRQHRTELINAGAIVLLRNIWFARPAALRSVILEVAQRSARATITSESHVASR